MSEIFLRNKTILDIMSLVHFVFGIGISLFIIFLFKNISKKMFFVISLSVLFVWEFFEAFLRAISVYYYRLRNSFDFLPAGWFSPESAINIIGDMIAGFWGILIIYLIFKKCNKFLQII